MALVTFSKGRRIICDEEDDDVVFKLGDTSHQNEKMPSTARAIAGADAEPKNVASTASPDRTSEFASPLRRPRLTKTSANSSRSSHTAFSEGQGNTNDRSNVAERDTNIQLSTRGDPSQPVNIDLPHRTSIGIQAKLEKSPTQGHRDDTPQGSLASSKNLPSQSLPAASRVISQADNGERVDANISIAPIRHAVERHWNLYMERHAKLLKTNLRHARTKKISNDRIPASDSHDENAPFSFNNLSGKDATSAPSTGPINLLHTSFPGRNTATAIKCTIEQPVLSAPTKDKAVVQYTNYIHLDKNILVENERRLVSWPKFAGYEDAGADYNHDVSNAYTQGLPDFWENAIPRLQMSQALGDCIEAALTELGCDFTDALRCLLDRPKNWRSGLGREEKEQLKDLSKLVPSRARSTLKKWEHERTLSSWRSILSRLPRSSSKDLAIAGLTCKAVLDVCKVSVWDVATQHQKYLDSLSQKTEQKVSRWILATELCRICWSHSCLCHGEFLDESESDTDSERDSNASTDSSPIRTTDMKRRVNVKQNVGIDLERSDRLAAEDMFYNNNQERSINESTYLGLRQRRSSPTGSYNHELGTDGNKAIPDGEVCSDSCFWEISNRQKPYAKWTSAEEALLRQQAPAYASNRRGPCLLAASLSKPCVDVFQHMLALSKKLPWKRPNAAPRASFTIGPVVEEIKERLEHYPCSHTGPCNSAECSCFANRVECEKSCRCDSSCRRRFSGCNCKRQGRICAGNPDCRCFARHRECDVDLCSSCGADEILDPANRGQTDKEFTKSRCHNVEIQRGIPKVTHVGNSTVETAGYGLFMGETAKKNDYVGEYVGFILSKTEADRLGVIYHELPHNYLFVANQDHEVDSLPAGNKMRFINHSSNPKTINCQAFLSLCNGVVHIALYTLKDIAVAEELFFDYGYTEEQTKSFVEKRVLENSAKNAGMRSGKINNIALRPEHKTSGKGTDVYPKQDSETYEVGLDDWPPPMKSDSDDEDYHETGGSSKNVEMRPKRPGRSARKRARSNSPSEAVSHDRKRVKTK